MKLLALSGLFVVSLFLFIGAAESQTTPTLKIHPYTGLPDDTYSFNVSGITASGAKRVTLQYCNILSSGSCEWKAVKYLDATASSGNLSFSTDLGSLKTPEGTSIKSFYKKVSRNETFRVVIEPSSGTGSTQITNSENVKFYAFCDRLTPSLSIIGDTVFNHTTGEYTFRLDQKSSDQSVKYKVEIKNNDPAECGASVFSVLYGKEIGDNLESRATFNTVPIQPGKNGTVELTTTVKGGSKFNNDFTMVVSNANSKSLGEANQPQATTNLVFNVEGTKESLCEKNVAYIDFTNPSVSGKTIVPGRPITFDVVVKNDYFDCGAKNIEITRIGVADFSGSRGSDLGGSKWFVNVDSYPYYSDGRSSSAPTIINRNSLKTEYQLPFFFYKRSGGSVVYRLGSGELKTHGVLFRPSDSTDLLGNRMLLFCVKMEGRETCATDFIDVKLINKEDDNTAPILSAEPYPLNPIPGDTVIIRANASDDYKLSSVSFNVNNNQESSTVSGPDAIVTSVRATYQAGTYGYSVKAYDWNNNIACFPSDCTTQARFTVQDRPDPYVYSFTVSSSTVKNLQTISFVITARNKGTLDVGGINAKVYIDDGTPLKWNAWDEVTIAKGDSQSRQFRGELIIPSEITEGKHKIWAEIHSTESIVERDPYNNRKSVDITLVKESQTVTTSVSTSDLNSLSADQRNTICQSHSSCGECTPSGSQSCGWSTKDNKCLYGSVSGSVDGTASVSNGNWVWWTSAARRQSSLGLACDEITSTSAKTESTSQTTSSSSKLNCLRCTAQSGKGYSVGSGLCLSGTETESSDGSASVNAGNWVWWSREAFREARGNPDLASKSLSCESSALSGTTSSDSGSGFSKDVCVACTSQSGRGYDADTNKCVLGSESGSTDRSATLDKGNWIWWSSEETKQRSSPALKDKSFSCEKPPSR